MYWDPGQWLHGSLGQTYLEVLKVLLGRERLAVPHSGGKDRWQRPLWIFNVSSPGGPHLGIETWPHSKAYRFQCWDASSQPTNRYSLVVQRIGIHLLMQGTWADPWSGIHGSLVREDSILWSNKSPWATATELTCHNYWSLYSATRKATAMRSSCAAMKSSLCAATKDPAMKTQHNNNNNNNKTKELGTKPHPSVDRLIKVVLIPQPPLNTLLLTRGTRPSSTCQWAGTSLSFQEACIRPWTNLT